MKLLKAILFLVIGYESLNAQEMRFIDLSGEAQRTVLRYPQPPPPVCKDGVCSGVGSGVGVSLACGAPDSRDPRALAVSIFDVVPSEITLGEFFELEFRVFNSGKVDLEIPVWPHLSDLQPASELTSFDYLSLALAVGISPGSRPEMSGSFGFVELYGANEDARTIMVLKPGQWIRVRARLKAPASSDQRGDVLLRGGFWLRSNSYQPREGGVSTQMRNLNVNETPTDAIRAVVTPAG